MSYNGSGTFVVNSVGQPVVTGTVISSTAFNALTADLATGLSTAITKDGQTTTTARILFAQGISSTLTTDATSSTTGSIITAGGISCQKALNVGTTTTLGGALTYGGVTLSNAVTGTGNMVLGTSPTISEPTCTSASANNCVILQRTGSSAGSARIYANSGDMFGVNDGTNYPFRVVQGASNDTLVAGTASVTVGKALVYGGVTLSNSVTGSGSMVLSASPTLTGNTTFYKSSGTAEPQIRLTTITDSQATQFAIGQGNGATSPFTIRYYNGSAWGDGAFAAGSANFSGAVGVNGGTTGTYNKFAVSGRSQFTGGAWDPGSDGVNGVAIGYDTTNDYGFVWTGRSGVANKTLRVSGYPLTFYYANTEAARIGTDGSFLVNTTTNGGWTGLAKLASEAASASNYAASFYNSAGPSIITRVNSDVDSLLTFYRSAYAAGSFISTGGATPNIQWLANNEAYVITGGSGGVKLTSGATAWASASDETLKTDLVPIQSGADKVSSLRAMTGRYKTDAEGVSRSFLIAQDVQAVLPEAVSADADGILSLRYTEVIPLLVAAIKELNTRLEALEGN